MNALTPIKPLRSAALPVGLADHVRTVRRLNAMLRGPVTEVIGELVPEVKALPRSRAFDAILDDPALLHRCFEAFHTNRERFRELLVDAKKVPVEEADALLACGRTLDQVVAMIVRTCAKRHFRLKLDGSSEPRRRPQAVATRTADPGLFVRVATMLGFHLSHAPALPLSRGETLYRAFGDYLRHDWQVPLVPEYTRLSPQVVRRLGARILLYRGVDEIRVLQRNPDAPAPKPKAQPVAAPKAKQPEGPAMAPAPELAAPARDERARFDEILSGDGKRLKSSAFTASLLEPKVRAVLPNSEQMVRVTGMLSSVGGLAAKMLVGELGLRKDQLAVLLLTAAECLGEDNFTRAFGVPGTPDYVARIVSRAKAVGINQGASLADVAAFVNKTFGKK
ncbi:MAG: hypothetical protein ACM31L_19970 [Actinomycetota bacterium]